MFLVQVIFHMRIRNNLTKCTFFRAIIQTGVTLIYRSHNIPVKIFCRRFSYNSVFPLRVLFFGSDNFALQSLKKLDFELKSGKILRCLDVVSSNKQRNCVIKKYSDSNGLQLLDWPLKNCKPEYDIGLVASFGHLIPEDVIKLFPLGMLNVHASLLPRWRGAAPVIHAIMNADQETGVSIMRIMPKRFDIGDVLAQSRLTIGPHDTSNIVLNKLAVSGAELLINCLKNLPKSIDSAQPQSDVGITYAPKVNASLAVIKWLDTKGKSLYNLWRALYGTYPLTTSWHGMQVKLIEARWCEEKVNSPEARPGKIEFVKSSKIILVTCADGEKVGFEKIGIAGKKPMTAEDFYNGYLSKKSTAEWYFT